MRSFSKPSRSSRAFGRRRCWISNPTEGGFFIHSCPLKDEFPCTRWNANVRCSLSFCQLILVLVSPALFHIPRPEGGIRTDRQIKKKSKIGQSKLFPDAGPTDCLSCFRRITAPVNSARLATSKSAFSISRSFPSVQSHEG